MKKLFLAIIFSIGAFSCGPLIANNNTELIKQRAEQGDVDAQLHLGMKYELGIGVRQDYAEAAKWTRKAAEQGHAAAQSALGMMYLLGLGVRQDYAEAKEWYGKSCDNGEQHGCDRYRELNEQSYQ